MNPLVLAQLTNMIGPLLGMVAQQAAARPSPEPQDQAPRIDAATISALTALVAAAAQRQEPQPAPRMPAMSAFVSIVILMSAITSRGSSSSARPTRPCSRCSALASVRCFPSSPPSSTSGSARAGLQGKGRGEERRRDCRSPAADDPGTAGAKPSTGANAAWNRGTRSGARLR